MKQVVIFKKSIREKMHGFKFRLLWVAVFLCKIPAHSEEKIIFVHIPKSGGVSVSSLLMNEYDNNHISNSLYSYGFHYTLYEIYQMLPANQFKLITFLRNPIDRILSEHKYCLGKHQGDPSILRAHRLPPIGDPLETASNQMCKILSGLDDQNEQISIVQHLDAAKKSLRNRFFFIGITEKMDESVHLLYSFLGWDPPQETPHLNSTKTTEIFTEETLQAIAKRNWADIELYEYATALYEQQKENRISFSEKEQTHAPVFIEQLCYLFDAKLNGYGWGIREIATPNEPIHRWATEKNTTTIDFYLKPDNDYQLNAWIFIPYQLADHLTILINSTPLLSQIESYQKPINESYTWIEYQISIPKEIIQKDQRTQVMFCMTSPENPELQLLYLEPNPYQGKNDNYQKGKFACKKIQISKR